MEMHERIKKVRTNNKMSQSEFAERLGVTRSVISNIELNRLAKPEQKVSLIKLISKEFNISEEWLLNGIEPMFVEEDTFSLDRLAKSKGATDFDIALIKYYFEFPKDLRDALKKHFETNILPDLKSKNEITATEEVVASSIEYEVESYRAELVAEQKGETYLVSENSEEKKDLA